MATPDGDRGSSHGNALGGFDPLLSPPDGYVALGPSPCAAACRDRLIQALPQSPVTAIRDHLQQQAAWGRIDSGDGLMPAQSASLRRDRWAFHCVRLSLTATGNPRLQDLSDFFSGF